MKLFEFMLLVSKRKKLVLWVVLISFVGMLLFTLFFNRVDYEISATVKLDGNILLLTDSTATQDKSYNRVDLKLDQLDDQSAMEYVQNNKNYFNDVNMIDYGQVVTKLNSKEFMLSTVNSQEFKAYLRENKVISKDEQLNIVEQTETLSLRITGDNADHTKEIYHGVVAAIPQYAGEVITKKIQEANTVLQTAIQSDREKAEIIIDQYTTLKNSVGFLDIANLNKGIELLNTLSGLSYNLNANSNVSNKFDSLLANPLAPDLILKSVDFSGLKFGTMLISYIIIELIAAILLGFLAVFIAEYATKFKVEQGKR